MNVRKITFHSSRYLFVMYVLYLQIKYFLREKERNVQSTPQVFVVNLSFTQAKEAGHPGYICYVGGVDILTAYSFDSTELAKPPYRGLLHFTDHSLYHFSTTCVVFFWKIIVLVKEKWGNSDLNSKANPRGNDGRKDSPPTQTPRSKSTEKWQNPGSFRKI